jgi:hypothetical protein
MIISGCMALIMTYTAADLVDETLPPEPGTCGHYAVLTGKVHTPPPFDFVDIVYGDMEQISEREFIWWQLSAYAQAGDDTPLFTLRAMTSRDPMAESDETIYFRRYMLRIHETGETLEYRDINTGGALIPGWRDFDIHFLPRKAKGSRAQERLPETAEYLGHVLTLQRIDQDVSWEEWDDARILNLDPELLVGTGRNFKDSEGHRLPQVPERQNYNYIKFTEDDYKNMLDAGVNLFTIAPEQERYVRSEPVFYIRQPGGEPPLRYPADLYRSNYIGSVMFMDEPAIIMVGDENIHKTLRYFSDAAATVQKRVRERYYCGSNYSAFKLETELKKMGVNFGDMRLEQHDYPAWETLYDMAYYEVAAGLAGVVHEGRYQLEPFDEAIAKWADEPRRHTPEEMLRYHFAFLRGAARAFGKHWGTSIYGQCDPKISPMAIKMAYQMGARYIWFWTSDHDHHVPWHEQLELVRLLREHIATNPRNSIFTPMETLDKAIAIPYGYFLSLGNLWWLRSLDSEGKNEVFRRYERVMQRSLAAIHEAMDQGEEFDITVNNGREIRGYRDVIWISDEE